MEPQRWIAFQNKKSNSKQRYFLFDFLDQEGLEDDCGLLVICICHNSFSGSPLFHLIKGMGNNHGSSSHLFARYQTRVAGMYVPDEVRVSPKQPNKTDMQKLKEGDLFKSKLWYKVYKSCRVSWRLYGLFQDLSTWTLDELKALKVSTEGKRRSWRPWVTPLQLAWAPWLPDQEKLILPPQNSWHLQCWLGRGCYITYRYKSLSSKIRFIEVDVPFLFPSLSGKDILLWFTNKCHRHPSTRGKCQAPESAVLLQVRNPP